MGRRTKFKNENWSYYKIKKMSQAAELYLNGAKINYDEYKELTLYSKRIARLANQRLRALKKAHKDYYAYDSAISFTKRAYNGNTRYKENLTEPDDMKRQILSAQRFLNYKTSTVEGHLEVEAHRRNTFRTKFPELNEISDGELDNFLRFLGDAPMRSTIFESGEGGSGTIVELIKEQYIGKSEEHKEEIRSMFERWRSTQERRTLLGEWREYDLGYDELIEYLKTGEDPTGYNKKGE